MELWKFHAVVIFLPGVISICKKDEIRCIDGSCVHISRVFDGKLDCPEGKYDEPKDFRFICKPFELNCADGRCIPRKTFLDGVNDCGDNSDEVEDPCPFPQFTCSSSPKTCVNVSNVHDDVSDCPDASDERKALGSTCGKDTDCGGNCTCDRFVNNSVCANYTCTCDVEYKMAVVQKQKRCVPRVLGDWCNSDYVCSLVIRNSECLDSACACLTAYLGDACESSEDCAAINTSSVCSEAATCVCPPSYVQQDNSSQCTPRLLGSECETHHQCAEVNNSMCDRLICSCGSEYIGNADGTNCVKRRIDDECSNITDCRIFIEHSDCIDHVCKCVRGYKPTISNGSCDVIQYGDACSDATDCLALGNAECAHDVCSCVTGNRFNDTENVCVRRRLFDKCANNTDCYSSMNNSICFKSSCVCDSNLLADAETNECRPRKPSDICENDTDCEDFVSNSRCLNSTCSCLPGYKSATAGSYCLPRAVGDHCDSDEDCRLVVNGECNNTCVCESGYIAVNNNTECIKRTVTMECDEDSDCFNAVLDSICSNSSCVCRSGLKAVENNTECELRNILDVCDTDSDCYDAVNNTSCFNGTCQCDVGFTQDVNASACNKRDLDDACDLDDDCSRAVHGSVCANGTCQCDVGFRTSHSPVSHCLRNAIGDACQRTADCYSVINDSLCSSGVCACATGFHPSDQNIKCVMRKIYDKTCHVMSDCSTVIPNSICFYTQCLCSSGFYPSADNRTCTKFKVGDRNCKTILDCKIAVPRSNCDKGECVCDIGYMAVNNLTDCRKRIHGDACSKDVDCAIIRSRCDSGACACEQGYEPLPDLTQCVYKPQKLLDICTFQEQCSRLDNRSICGNQHGSVYSRITSCVCVQGHWVRSDTGTCYAPTRIGDYCEDRSWCGFGLNVQCEGNRCACRPGYIANATFNGCVELPSAVGHFCRTDAHCERIQYSICASNNTCQCHYMYYPAKGGSKCLKREYIRVPEVPPVALGAQCDTLTNRPCSDTPEGRKHWRCTQEMGRQHARCMCVPGYASKHSNENFFCEEIQTYYFDINITSEIGCDESDAGDAKVCYVYQPFRVLKQYGNENTKYFVYIRDRITLSGLAALFNETGSRVRDRYVNSEVVNLTESGGGGGLLAGVLVYLAADYYNIINDTELKAEMIGALSRSNGEIGKSGLKIKWPYEDEIEYREFDECTEMGGAFSDCSPIAWCLDTRVSYMCSCRHGYDDWSPDNYKRPGRECIIPVEVTTDSLSCSNGKCENEWGYISLVLIGFGIVLFIFIGYEIYARKKKLQQSDIYFKLQKQARRAKVKEIREKRKTIKRLKKDEIKQSKKAKESKEEGNRINVPQESSVENVEYEPIHGDDSDDTDEDDPTGTDDAKYEGTLGDDSRNSGGPQSLPEPETRGSEDGLHFLCRNDGYLDRQFSEDHDYLLEEMV